MKSLLVIAALAATPLANGAIVRIDYKNGTGFELNDNAGVPLTQGNPAVDQDGAVIQVGYYTLATTSDPFAGDWVPMIGPGQSDPLYATIGDKGGKGAGLFSGEGGFGETSPGPFDFPAVGMPLSIRFYDATTIGGAGHFNAVSSAAWLWEGPGDPENLISMNLSNAILLWQDGPDSAFRTTIPVPEPGVAVLLGAALGAAAFRRTKHSLR
jgi:hypothetical protein